MPPTTSYIPLCYFFFFFFTSLCISSTTTTTTKANLTLPHQHPHPESVVLHLQRKLNASISTTTTTRRRRGRILADESSSSSSSCVTGNPIDDCWRCDPNWANNRQRLADCGIGFGQDALGGKNGQIYIVTDSSDPDPVNPTPGTLRYGVIQSDPLWITFSNNMLIHLKEELSSTASRPSTAAAPTSTSSAADASLSSTSPTSSSTTSTFTTACLLRRRTCGRAPRITVYGRNPTATGYPSSGLVKSGSTIARCLIVGTG
ncbi:hypothetical protein Syun_000735 [Stephania yunnanensis]|uniref:Pectate lyase n=1 Tax=Stephania yunnanensis TaxID=152371 RepID=A0AAP0Q5U5_9MAGN